MSAQALTPIAATLAKLIAALGSSFDGEVVGARNAIRRKLDSVGADFSDLAAVVAAVSSAGRAGMEPQGDLAVVEACLKGCRALSQREIDFLVDVHSLLLAGVNLTTLQSGWIRRIWAATSTRRAA
jgi:hypothetical protein